MSHRIHIRNRLSKCSCDDFDSQNSTEQLTLAIEGSETMGQRHNWKDRFVNRTTKPAEGSELEALEKSNPGTYHGQTLLGVGPRIDWWIPQPPLFAICPPAELEKVSTRSCKKREFLLYPLRCLRKEYVGLRDFEGGQAVSLAGSTVPLSKIWCIC